jgi:hypothetical protein
MDDDVTVVRDEIEGYDDGTVARGRISMSLPLTVFAPEDTHDAHTLRPHRNDARPQ